jgi:hypothetical protein
METNTQVSTDMENHVEEVNIYGNRVQITKENLTMERKMEKADGKKGKKDLQMDNNKMFTIKETIKMI